MIRALAVATALAGLSAPAWAHDQWADGTPVPSWVKAACCGVADAHHLADSQVQTLPDGYHVAGYNTVIPYGHDLPSPDGSYWIFYGTFSNGSQTQVYCFFVPVESF